MRFLLDTNAISEWMKPRPDPGVLAWMRTVHRQDVFLSVITIAEVRQGVERIPSGSRRSRLDQWLSDELPSRFAGRILGVDAEVADGCGRILARRRALGRPIGIMDAFVASIANRHGLTLVTRNVSDFDAIGLSLLTPWTGLAGPPA